MVMKFPIPDSLYRIQLEAIESEPDMHNVTVILNETFIAWAEEHNIVDYEAEVDQTDNHLKFYVSFASDSSGLMFRLSWSDKY
jgi:hypothetical protein